jgi:Ca-activated chloride channel family protein
MPQYIFGQKSYVQVPVDIDEDTLKAIANKTGGKYFRADNAEALRKIYEEIDKLEKTDVEVKKHVNVKELLHWLVLPGLGLLLLEIALGHTVWRKLP